MGIEENEKRLKDFFSASLNPEQKYQKIIELGKRLPPQDGTENRDLLVPGCQSRVYIKEFFDGKTLHFTGSSDALISSGLAYLAMELYRDLTPQEIIRAPSTLFDELQIFPSLSPGRSNGLSNILLYIKKLAVRYLSK